MILVEVETPALDTGRDFRLDENLSIAEIMEELGCILFGKKLNNMILCSCEHRRVLSSGRTLRQSGIRDGAKLLFL